MLDDLAAAGCVTIDDDFLVSPTTHGHIASYYYLDYRTIRIARDALPREAGARERFVRGCVQLAASVCDANASQRDGDVVGSLHGDHQRRAASRPSRRRRRMDAAPSPPPPPPPPSPSST